MKERRRTIGGVDVATRDGGKTWQAVYSAWSSVPGARFTVWAESPKEAARLFTKLKTYTESEICETESSD